MRFISNAFSLNMLDTSCAARLNVAPLPSWQVADALAREEVASAVGHDDTARLFSKILGVPIPTNRTTLSLAKGDCVYVGQYRGPRLPEGTTELPEGATVVWILVEVM